jgi:hypothetical protein
MEAQQLAVDENGRILIWTGASETLPTGVSVPAMPESTAVSVSVIACEFYAIVVILTTKMA